MHALGCYSSFLLRWTTFKKNVWESLFYFICCSYQQFSCPESPKEYIAIPLGNTQQLYMPSTQAERVREEKEIPADTVDNLTDNITFQVRYFCLK